MTIPPDDPRLTDYALGEMDGKTAKQFEAAISENPSTFDEIHEIRGTAGAVEKTVAALPVHTLTDTQRHRILRLADAPSPEALMARPENVIRPAFWGWFGKFAAGTAAAALVVVSLIFAYQRGYRNAVADTSIEKTGKGSVSKSGALPGETPSIQIRVVDPEGEIQPVVSRPLSPDSVLPVGEESGDALVAAVPKVHSPPAAPDAPGSDPGDGAGTGDGKDPETAPDSGGGLAVAADVKPSQDAVTPASIMENPFVEVSSSPRSSFPLRTGTDAFTSAAGSIQGAGKFPDPSTVAVEEIVNAFDYGVPGFVPTSSYRHPFAAGAEVFSCPWAPQNRLVRVTVTGFGSKAEPASDPEIIAEEIELLVEFNRSRAARYRLIGFDGAGLLSAVSGASPKARALHAGDTITALYEVVPAEGAGSDDLRYTPHNYAAPPRNHARELLCLSISYKDVSRALANPEKSLEVPVIDPGLAWNRSSGDFQWAAATAAFGMILSGSEHIGGFGFDQIHALAERSLRYHRDSDPRREAFLELLQESERLSKE